jgi:hypothetical protein
VIGCAYDCIAATFGTFSNAAPSFWRFLRLLRSKFATSWASTLRSKSHGHNKGLDELGERRSNLLKGLLNLMSQSIAAMYAAWPGSSAGWERDIGTSNRPKARAISK